ncbi:hypothetical protein AGOR_G00130190 [Albula goreensis]|uniref:Chromogranin A n=1 Tax=Albula goreensis TaxID=1534307 RepID=A0A8T3D927_9TELE|nr:hypothetical protein AGOR_G00130190 [Albula goreensis]
MVFVFLTLLCGLGAVGSLPLPPVKDEKVADCVLEVQSDSLKEDSGVLQAACSSTLHPAERLDAAQRHQGLLRELQELAQNERDKEKENLREKEEYERSKMEGPSAAHGEEKPEAIVKKKGGEQEEQKRMEEMKDESQMNKRMVEHASDEATHQFDRERVHGHGAGREMEEEEDDEVEADGAELLEIEAELRRVAAELRELRRG